MSYDPNSPTWPATQPAGYQPPEGTNPGTGAGGLPPGGAAPAYQAQPAYYGAYPGPMAPSTSGWAIASLVLSITSYFILFVVGALLGIIFGHMALNEIKRSEGRLEGRGLAIAGLVLGYAHFAIVVCAVAVILAIAFGVFASAGFPR